MQAFIVALFLGVALIAAQIARAAETDSKPLELRPKSALENGPRHGVAPFALERGGAPVVDFAPERPRPREQSPSACSSEHTLCYDSTEGHIVYRPARMFMPDLPGLTRENITIKRHLISFRYSF